MRLSAACLAVCAHVFLAVVGGGNAARILAVFHFQSRSHFSMLEALAKGLVAKGHHVTVVSHFPQKTPIPNYTDISLTGTVDQVVNNITVDYILKNWRAPLKILDFIWHEAGRQLCDTMYKADVFRNLFRSNDKYDLLITELWSSDCFLPLAHHFRTPHISMITTMEVPWCLDRYGSPLNPSYHVNHFTAFSPTRPMTFVERLVNTLFTAYMKFGYWLASELPTEKIIRRHLGDSAPDLTQMVRNSSLLFVNSHLSLNGPRPFTPNVVEVGGLHIADPKPLPEELKQFLDEAQDGVILFSLGSLIRSDSFDEGIIAAFVEEFSHLPQRVLWKFNGTIKNQSKNLKTLSWLPQNDVLNHPNVKLFITHGGLMGTQEAIAAGVPMLGIPFFADQTFNILNYQEKGFALMLELEDINPTNLRTALRRLLTDPRYKERAVHYSKLFRDRPQTPLDTAIYWTEYVVRHGGAPHMRPVAADMSFVAYHLIDVAGLVVAVAGGLAYLVHRRCFSRRGRRKHTADGRKGSRRTGAGGGESEKWKTVFIR